MWIFTPVLILMSFFAMKANALHLKNGDLILQPTDCYLCRLIEVEEQSPYSHMGVLVLDGKHWMVMEAWGKVRLTNLDEFLKRRKKNAPSLILRSNHEGIHDLKSSVLLSRFSQRFDGLSYDPEFLWNNADANGEKLYCSEFAVKFLQPFLPEAIPTKPMHYEMNREAWIRYFHGNPPDGAPGISPGDFERSPLFHKVGFL